MSTLHSKIDYRNGDDGSSEYTAARSRISTDRANRLREFICGHLPSEVTVDVVISAGIQTAAVLPADVEAVLSSDAADFERSQVERLLSGVDADYLVLVTGTEADLSRIPLNDQLTADHAHQFGLAFHELLHILKTAISTIGELIEADIDDEYRENVHDLINIIEDGAIESEAIHGENFSDNAGVRLELTRRLHSQTPADKPDGESVVYSFWDAVTACLYEEAIYPTGITEVLVDDSDGRISFKSDSDRDAFLSIHSELCNLSRHALAIRSADRDDTTHSHDKTASVRRAARVIETWNVHLQPVLDAGQRSTPSQDSSGNGHAEQTETTRSSDSENSTEPAQTADDSTRNGGGGRNSQDESGHADSTGEEVSTLSDLPDDFDPDNISLDRESTADPNQSIFEKPQLTPDPESGDLAVEDFGGVQDSTEEGTPTSDGDRDGRELPTDGDAATVGESAGDVDAHQRNENDCLTEHRSPEDVGNETVPEPSSRAEAIAQAADRERRREQDHETTSPGRAPPESGEADETTGSGKEPLDIASSSSPGARPPETQSTLREFETNSSDGGSSGDHTESEPDDGEGEDSTGETTPDSLSSTDTPAKVAREDTRTTASSDSSVSQEEFGRSSTPGVEEQVPEGPAHAACSERDESETEDTYKDALEHDERAAHDEAEREAIDQETLEQELTALSEQLERSSDEPVEAESAQGDGGQSGGPGSLDELSILPAGDEVVPPREWDAIEEGAEQVGETLKMYLRLDRRKSVRRGLSAGAYDTRAGHRLAIGDPRVCKSRTLGNEKQYALVLVLDRSSSMRHGSPRKIEVATQALARFALAAENLGIRVAVIDFIGGEARLIKPFSVPTRHVQAALLDDSVAGGTPLADALGLARNLLETQRDEPMIITVTDGEPSSVEDVKSQITSSFAPICSLTIATDSPSNTLSEDASELARYYERQEAVFSPERLDDRLDQFASLLAGL
ncbi:VWA domain-containing protein [Halosimplex halobium]|uniref:VWA domain-containing protein n=1 Tax=Halosimplex halobium TaxID=3396618 RepID=UPI003F580200